MKELKSIIKFVELIHDFQNVERVMWLKGREHRENDVEHSYQLAMVAWYAISTFKLPLNTDKAIKYGLLHDLVEVYAGDTDAFDKDASQHESKVEREHAALVKLKSEFAEFPEMIALIEQYELREDEESKFVYALDKIIAPINVYLDDGRTWQKKGITFDKLLANKLPKVSAHPETKKYFDQLVVLLETQQHLFPKEDEKI